MKARHPDAELAAAVAAASSVSEVLVNLGLKPTGGGSRTSVRKRILELGLDTSHFVNHRGRARTRLWFLCKHCGGRVELAKYEVPRTYCSPDCLRLGRAASIRSALAAERIRIRISEGQRQSWANDGVKRRASMMAPIARERRLNAVREAGKNPELRATRSMNAKLRWESDPVSRQKFQQASRVSRCERATRGELPHKPRVPFSPDRNMRSLWERDFGLLLEAHGLRWKYEPTHVLLESGARYTPDFEVEFPFATCYVEVHRVVTRESNDRKFYKMAMTRRRLGQPLLLVGEAEINEIRKQLRSSRVEVGFWYRLFFFRKVE